MWQWAGTLLVEQMLDEAEELSCGVRVLEELVWTDHWQIGPMTLWRLQESAAYEQRNTRRCGNLWKRLMLNNEKLST